MNVDQITSVIASYYLSLIEILVLRPAGRDSSELNSKLSELACFPHVSRVGVHVVGAEAIRLLTKSRV